MLDAALHFQSPPALPSALFGDRTMPEDSSFWHLTEVAACSRRDHSEVHVISKGQH